MVKLKALHAYFTNWKNSTLGVASLSNFYLNETDGIHTLEFEYKYDNVGKIITTSKTGFKFIGNDFIRKEKYKIEFEVFLHGKEYIICGKWEGYGEYGDWFIRATSRE